jgi:hypothetical protein
LEQVVIENPILNPPYQEPSRHFKFGATKTRGKRSITADTDLRLCRFFGLSNGYWLRAQAAHDTEVAEEALAEALVKIKPWSGLRRDSDQPV